MARDLRGPWSRQKQAVLARPRLWPRLGNKGYGSGFAIATVDHWTIEGLCLDGCQKQTVLALDSHRVLSGSGHVQCDSCEPILLSPTE